MVAVCWRGVVYPALLRQMHREERQTGRQTEGTWLISR